MASQLSILNPYPQKLHGPSLLHDLLQQNVGENTPALDFLDDCGERHITSYENLHLKSNILASHLHHLRSNSGIHENGRFIVPVFIGQCPELYMTQLAILKAGGAFCPLTLDVPEERLRFILQDASASVLVTTAELKDRLPHLENVSVVVADEIMQGSASECLTVEIDPKSPAYVMYTSGSTGQPKGVLLSHSAATQALLAHDRHIPQFSRFLQFASPTFDVSVFEIFFPLFRGCTLVVCDRKTMLNDLPATINNLNVDAAELTPSVANSLLSGRASVPGLKVLLTIGEMLKQAVVEDFGGSSDEPAVLHGMYGPTEATIHCTLQPNFGKDMPVNNIGIPLDTVSAFIVRPASDEHPSHLVEILPVGEEGELAVGGYQLADGYLNREEQTKAAFVSHPEFGQLYRTGDRAKLDSQQRLMCLGRISSGQVKLRGQRIELGEIEYAASRTPGCRDVSVDVISDTLVAFCVSDSPELTEGNIQATCRKWLPPYMVPTDILLMDTMPYLASGKIDRRTLQSLHKEYRDSEEAPAAKEVDAKTKQLADIFNDVLKLDILRLPTLAAAGIDSLSAIRLASKLRSHGFAQANATDILELSSLADLRSRFEQPDAHPKQDTDVSLLHDESITHVLEAHDLLSAHMSSIQDIIACTPVQNAMLSETAKDPHAYCNWIEMRVDLHQTMEKVENAVYALTAHHEMLRAGFVALQHVRHPHASVIWDAKICPNVRQVVEFDYDFSISDDTQLFKPRPVQLQQSEQGIRILLQLHHAVYDQWSMDVIKKDLDALLQGNQLHHQPSYSAISAFYFQHGQQNTPETEIEYWQAHLQGAAATPFPQLNGQKMSRGLQRSSWLPLDVSTALLKQKAADLNASSPVIFQAAFAYLLGLYTGASDVMYGSVFSGRHIPVAEVEHIVGPCLATLPARTDITSARTCKDLIRTIHDQNRKVLKHSTTPLAEVKRIGKFAPNEIIFDALFVWQESTFEPPQLVCEVDSADHHELNLVLEVEPRADNVAVRVTYQQDRLHVDQVQVLSAQLQYIVQQLIEDAHSPVASLLDSLPTQMSAIDNPHPTNHPHQRGLVSTLEELADRMPSEPALIFGESLSESAERLRSLSYSEMHAQANQMARHLVSQKVEPDDLVCICMDKSLDLYVAILAVLKTGAGYLPLLPDTPKDRVASVLEQTSVKAFLCDRTVPDDVRSVVNTNIFDLQEVQLSQYSCEKLALPYNGSHAAYSIFTSGSTGTPKGLVVTQDNLLGNLSTLTDIYPVDQGDRLLQACSQAFDVSVFEIFFAFFTGMPLCFARKDELFQDIERSIRVLKITHLSLTPTVAALVDPENVPSVRFLVTAGEAMTDVVHRRWAGNGLHQGYGPSETTNICTVNPQMPASDIISNIGPAFRNTSAFVIRADAPFEILPFGAVGELAFGGEQVFRGYVGRDELNAEKIISHPLYGRVYRSGDIGRMLPNGTILISGRLDDQVKVRGNRIELGEINTSLLSQAGVNDCTTLVLGKDAASQMIASFWIPDNVTQTEFEVVKPTEQLRQQISALYEHMESSLPPYMIPTAIIPMTTLPRTTQGKLDKRLLDSVVSTLDDEARSSFFRSSGNVEGDEGDWTSFERELASALEGVIKLPLANISRNSSFFALGLNSVNAIAFAKAIEKRINKTVAVGTILRHSSLARLARTLTEQPKHENDRALDLSKVFPEDLVEDVKSEFKSGSQRVVAVLPCTPLQEAMLSASVSQKDAAYSNQTTFIINGDLTQLKQVFRALVTRHAILRTKFHQTSNPDYPFVQAIIDDFELPWTEKMHTVDAKGHRDGTVEAAQVTMDHPFQVVADITADVTRLTLYMHHAIYDGTSISVLLEEAERMYNGQVMPEAPALEPFLTEVHAQSGPDAMAFWSRHIDQFSAKPFPLRSDAPTQPLQSRIIAPLTIASKDLDGYTRRHNISVASLFQAAWTKVLTKAQNTDDVCFGDVVSGRSVPVAGVDRLVAPCFNTVPVRVFLDDTQTNIGLARSLHEHKISADPYQLAPLRRIQAQSNTPDSHLFDSLMLVQPPTRELNKDFWEIREDEGLMDLPLVVEIVQSSEKPELLVHYDSLYFSQATASTLADAFAKSLQDCVQFPSGNARDIASIDSQLLDGVIATDLIPDDPSPAINNNTSTESWSEEEQIIRQAFSQFSKIEESKIHRHTSLYRLGLDSLNAVQVASRLRAKGLTMTAADVMEHRTPAAIAEAAAAASARTPDSSEDVFGVDLATYESARRSKLLEPLGVSTSSLEALLPCTAAQNGMLAQSLQSQGSLYVNHIIYEMPDQVSESEILDAWRQLQRKHQALRMGFVQTDEAQCPFAMMVYHEKQIELPAYTSTTSEAEVAAAIVKTLHLPTWQVNMDFASSHRQLTLSIHHALYDAESLQILLSDFDRALRHEDVGRSPDVKAVLLPMLMGSEDAKTEAERFWRKSLENVSVAPFPNLNPVVTTRFDLYNLQKRSALSYSTLEDLCKARGCTIQAAGQSAWAQLLSAYLGEGGVTFGTVFSGRTGSKKDSVVFPSLATVPVFCNTANADSQILTEMTNFNGSAQRHKYVPLSDIQRYANLPGQALFDTVFVYQKSASGTHGGLSWPIIRQSAAVDYNVSIELETTPSGDVILGLTVNRGVVPDEHACLLLEQYDHMLARILGRDSASSTPSADLYSATPAQYDSLSSPVHLLHQFVEVGAQKWPGQPALEFVWNLGSSSKSRQTWSYQVLNERANQTAHLLQSNGVNSGDIVGVCMHKCPEASIAFVGILKAGCAFLALDPELPLARKQFILQDSGAKVLLVDESNGAQSDDLPANVVELSAEKFDAFPTSSVDIGQISPQATCYCLYTSGTTGTPKGCELTHENAVQAMMAFQNLFAGRWNSSSRWLQFASYWFDVSVLEQFWSWSVGITLVGAPRDLVLDDLTLFIQQLHITHIDLTPSLARILDPEDVPSLWDGVFITGGEALKQEIIEKWGSHRSICNGYGPTEATIGVTMNPFIGPDAKASNIGPAFLNVGSYVFNPGTEDPVLRGAVGELCVSGKLVGKGYLNRPELTAKAFPVLQKSGEKIYRTGDLVRQAADGSFLFIGRQDSQAKLRGQRLEIDEIDSVIKQSSAGIADVASLVIKSPGGDKETLVTFFITAVRKQTRDVTLDVTDGSRDAAQRALEACHDRLPGYMVPTHILPVNVIPLTVNNKIDSKRLNAFYHELSVSALQNIKGNASSNQPLGENDRKICSVLAQMLYIDTSQIDRSSNLFSLGLSSVSAISLATLLKRAGFSVSSVALIMRHPTVGQLSDALSRGASQSEDFSSVRQAQMSISAFNHRHRHMAASRLAIKVEDIEYVAPCTPLQQGLILESLRNEEGPYFNKFTFIADGLDFSRLRTAFQQVADLAQPLRTKFLQTDDGHAQIILRRQETPWYQEKTQQDLSSMVLEQQAKWVSRNQQEIVSPFEISVFESPTETLLTVHIHHALYDGISFDQLMNQVSLAYHGQPVDCGPKFTEVLAYGPLRTSKGADSFWMKHLSGMNNTGLPTMGTDMPEVDPVETRALGRGVDLDGLCKRLGVSHQAIAQSCFSVALHQFAPKNGTYGMVVSGRSIAFDHADKVLGPLFNTIPSPLHLQSGDTWEALIHRCHEFNAAALPHQHTPLRDIKKWCKRAPSDSVFDALFVFQTSQVAETTQTSNFWKPIGDQTKAEYPLAFELELDAQRELTATVVAKRTTADGPMLQRLLQSFEEALRLISEDSQKHIAQDVEISPAATSSSSETTGAPRMPYLNGVHGFEWIPEANKLRAEIARMASLDEQEIDEHTTIFSLGLDSIDAVKLTSKLKRSGVLISVSKLLRAQTIPRILSSLERPLESQEANASDSGLQRLERQLSTAMPTFAPVDKSQVDRIIPATPGQEALIAEMIRSDFHEYYNHDVLRIAPDVDIKRLQSAWQAVVDVSPILRTCFVEVSSPDVDAIYAQVILRPQTLNVKHANVQDASEIDALLENIRNEARLSPSAIPTRLMFVETISERFLILSLAHSQYDGHALALVHEDVGGAYEQTNIESRPAADSFINASLAAVNDQALEFWRSTLSGALVSRFPVRNDKIDSTTLHRAESTSSISATDARKFCQNSGISLQSLAQTSWALVLAHYTRRFDTMFGAVLACRDSEEAGQVLFPMMNTVVMRATLHGTRREMLKYMQDINTDVLAYQRTPLRFIQSAAASVVRSEPSDQSNSLFDTLFVYQHRPDSTGLPKQPLYESVGGSSSIEYPVAVEMEAVDGDLIFRAACKESVLDLNGTQELLRRLDQVLVAIVSSPDEPTVQFQDTQASVCGLPLARFREDDLGEIEHLPEGAYEDENLDSSTESTVIKSALSQVSRTPPEELSASSTIESIGIDSISAIKVIALLRKQGVKLSVSELVRARTVSGMAKAVQDRASVSAANGSSANDIVAQHVAQHELAQVVSSHGFDESNIQAILPALPGQLYMLKVWQATRGQLFYPTFTYKLDSEVSETQIEDAWKTLVSKNAILRTVFCTTKSAQVPMAQVILRDAPNSFNSLEREQAHTSRQPMVHLQAFKSESAWTLKLTIHHALYDAISLPLLMNDLQELVAGSPPAQPPTTLVDYLALSTTPSAQTSRKEFWTRYLTGINPITLPQTTTNNAQARVDIFKPALLPSTRSLESLARSESLTPHAILFAAHARAYAQLVRSVSPSPSSDDDDIVLGIYLSNRSHTEHLPSLRAPTLNLVPLLIRAASTTPLLESAKRVQRDLQSIGSAENSSVGLWEIAEWTGVRVDAFVNFLRLPENENTDENAEENGDANGRLEAVEDERLASRARVIEASENDTKFQVPDELVPANASGENRTETAYLHSLDLEATITPTGSLDVGLFCPADMLGLVEAESVLRELRRELDGLGA